MREVCGTCKYNKSTYDGHCNTEFCCGNENSDNYSVPTFYDDTCDDWEEKDMKPKEEGGLNYKEIIDWINEHGDLNIRY